MYILSFVGCSYAITSLKRLTVTSKQNGHFLRLSIHSFGLLALEYFMYWKYEWFWNAGNVHLIRMCIEFFIPSRVVYVFVLFFGYGYFSSSSFTSSNPQNINNSLQKQRHSHSLRSAYKTNYTSTAHIHRHKNIVIWFHLNLIGYKTDSVWNWVTFNT